VGLSLLLAACQLSYGSGAGKGRGGMWKWKKERESIMSQTIIFGLSLASLST